MTQRNSKWLPLTLTAAVLLTAATAWAQPRGGAGRFGPPGAGFGPGHGLLYGPVGDRLELTDEQRDEVLKRARALGLTERHAAVGV